MKIIIHGLFCMNANWKIKKHTANKKLKHINTNKVAKKQNDKNLLFIKEKALDFV